MTTASSPSQRLVARAAQGDHAALDELLDRNQRALVARLASSIPKDVASLVTPEDVADIVRIETHGRLSGWRPRSDGSFLAWLAILADESLLIAAKAYARIRRSSPQMKRHEADCRLARETASPCVALAEALAPTAGCGCSEPAPAIDWRKHQAELEASLAAQIEDFPQPYAAVIRAVDLEGRPVEAVAADLNRSIGWVLMARGHAIARLNGAWPRTPARG